MAHDRATGVVLVVVSALVFSCAGLFVRAIDAEAWTIIFWRGVFAAAFTYAFIVQRGTVQKEVLSMGRAGVAAALVGALGTMAFIPSFKLTTIANVSLIYAIAPFVAALIMWLWVRERPTTPVVIGGGVAMVGVFIIVGESVGGVNLRGDLLALLMTLLMSVYLCIYRRFPATPAAGPAVLMSLLLLPVAWAFGDPFNVSMQSLLLIACFGVVFSIASVTLAEGSRRLPASQTALLSALETPLAPLWAVLLFAEVPTSAVMLGGTIILFAVIGSIVVKTEPTPVARADSV